MTFAYTVNVPPNQAGVAEIAAMAVFTQSSSTLQILAKPDPLWVLPARHVADTRGASPGSSSDGRIDLFEFTRVIELFNTRNGTTRTGCYKVQSDTEDGFAPDPNRADTTTVALARYHSADTTVGGSRDGKISLFELTRLIALYNHRAGTVRTGQYRVQIDTEDGFAPGP